jgi:Anti-sigma factor NepR
MGKNDDMAANPPGPDDGDEADADAADMGSEEDSIPPDEAAGEEDPNLAGLSSQLRGLYKGLLDEPIPDRFMHLLKELESKESETK